jgi:hypothetical protein
VLHFDIRPLNSISHSGSDCFKKSLFGCKEDGKAFSRSGPSLAPEDLLLRKDPAKEEISPAGYHLLDPFDIHNVDTCTENHIKFGIRLPSPTYLRPPKRGLGVGGSGYAQAGSADLGIKRFFRSFRIPQSAIRILFN